MLQPGVTSPILGARTLGQLEDNLGCLDFTLDDEHLARLNEATAIEPGFPNSFVYSPGITTGTVARAKMEERG
jgi:diketogulonate reductase-like aldo/keto reductase